jgi:LPPG:FO 2-phospho-L-lactate transferase
MLAVPGLRAALAASPARVVAVSPLVAGEVLKGPTAACLSWAGLPLNAEGIAAAYAGVADALLADEPAEALPTRVADVLMTDAEGRRRVAADALALAEGR